MKVLSTLALGFILSAAPVLASIQLTGSYQSLCSASGYMENAVTTQSTLTFSNGVLEQKQRYYNDPACKQFPLPNLEQTITMSYSIGNAVPRISYPQGNAYKINFLWDDVEKTYCFYLGSFLTGEEALFFSKGPLDASKDPSCELGTDQIWVKL